MENKKVKVSALNLVPQFQGETTIDAINRAVELGKILENLDYHRYWVAEHHNFRGVVSSATALLIQHILSNTKRIKVGAGGVMLPNHSPLQVAETYGTLETLYPHRVDLGVGRAPGTDGETARLIYRQHYADIHHFMADILQLEKYFGSEEEQGTVIANPGINTNVPIIILGSSTSSAYIAAELGLPYSFATHFAPAMCEEALEIYRKHFKPSKYLKEPYFILGALAHGADTNEEAQKLYTVAQQGSIRLLRDEKDLYPLADENFEKNLNLSSAEKIFLKSRMGINLMGSKETMAKTWKEIKEKFNPDEIIAVSYMPKLEQLEKSYKILKEVIENN